MTTLSFADRPRPWMEARARVLVALHAMHSPHGPIGVGRLIAGAMRAPLHGVLVWPTELEPCDVPRVLRLAPEALDGVVLDVEVGDPAERLSAAALSQPVAFVVVSGERGAAGGYELGVVASRLLEVTQVSLILVRPNGQPSRLRRVLVPLDGTPSTAAAIGPALRLARDAGASVDIVLVGDPFAAPPEEPGSMQAPQYVDQPQHEWPAFSEEFLQRFLRSIGHAPAAVPTRFFLGAGDPASEILRFAAKLESDLIALVWYGSQTPHGHVFDGVVRGADRPILVLRR